jgi:hypothetical protein
MSHVFITYRRRDAAGYAGRLSDALAARLGRRNVFRDLDSLPVGRDFVAELERTLASCDAVIAVIDRDWASVPGEDGRPRLSDPDDFVRLEIAAALRRDILLVPAVTPGAAMPSEQDLPDELQPLARRNAVFLSDASWDADVDRIVRAVRPPAPPRPGRRRALLVALAAALLAITGGGWLVTRDGGPSFERRTDDAVQAATGHGTAEYATSAMHCNPATCVEWRLGDGSDNHQPAWPDGTFDFLVYRSDDPGLRDTQRAGYTAWQGHPGFFRKTLGANCGFARRIEPRFWLRWRQHDCDAVIPRVESVLTRLGA